MNPSSTLARYGGFALLASAFLFTLWALFTALAGFPPAPAPALGPWVADHRLWLQLSDEALFFASVSLLPALAAWAVGLGPRRPAAVVTGVGALGVAVVLLQSANLFLGRLVYPVFGLDPSAEGLAQAVTGFYGALHAFDLAAAVGVVALGLAVHLDRRAPAFLALSGAAAVTEVLSAYPWLFDPWTAAALRLGWVLWLGAAGVGLLAARRRS